MKTIVRTTLFIALLVGLTAEVNAQWVTTGAANTMSVSNPLGNRHLFLENTDSTGAPLKFYLSGNTISAGLQIGRDDSGHDIFLLGDVGIGSISAPSYKLDVNGTFGVNGIATFTNRIDAIASNGGSINQRWTRTDNSINWDLVHAGDRWSLYETGGNDVTIGLDAGSVDKGNSLGIGTAAGSYRLNVNGAVKTSGALTSESANPTMILKETGVTDNNWDIQVNNGDFKILKVNDARSTFDEVFHISDNNRVGIGTGSPQTNLEVKNGTLLVSGGSGLGQGDARFIVDTDNSTAHVPMILRNDNGTLFRVNGNGNVGVGTTNPQSALDLGGGTNGNSIVWGGPTGTNHYSSIGTTYSVGALSLVHGLKLDPASSNYQYSYANMARAGIKIGNFTNGDISFFSAPQSNQTVGATYGYTSDIHMIIKETGNVGVGTSTPVGLFQVNASGTSDVYLTAGSSSVAQINFGDTDDINAGRIDFLNSDNSLRFVTSDAYQFTLTSSGNVGIGTTSPDQKLTVAGTVKSQEVIVEATAGADFVFEEDYDLPTLAEIEKFIKANKHLEGISPADEMVKNGVKVGELQIKLLQKIEELTLHTIEQQKKLIKQDKESGQKDELIKELIKRIEKLENMEK